MKFNNPEYKYVDATVIINNVKNKLSSYFEQGSLDESLLYPTIKSCLDRMGYKVHPTKHKVIEVKDRYADLPNDFFKLNFAIGSANYEKIDLPTDSSPARYVEKAILSVDKGDNSNACQFKAPCENGDITLCGDNYGQLYQFYQEFDMNVVKYSSVFAIKVVDSGERASNFHTEDTPYFVTIKNGGIYANFNGSIYIEYLSTMENEDLEMIVPDYTQITDWIEKAMMVTCFEKLYLNGEGDVLQRLQYLNNSLGLAEAKARSFYKMLEVQDMYDIRTVMRSRFMKYSKAVYGRLPTNSDPSYTYNSTPLDLRTTSRY